MKQLITVLFISLSLQLVAQSKKQIKKNGITAVKTLEQDISLGEKELWIEKEEHFDQKGELVEIKKFYKKGKIKSWERFTYNEAGLLASEEELNAKGETIKLIEYKYENGLRTQKLYYDAKKRLYKKKKYEYQYE
ncbi:hypothetical protein QQ008_12680 [Fulvivirgaceae bacterium BMA10]|uniref:Uncharacterized protein n=1 Tax=Splendidivirga corallicola TaxID=3051826 RepID=A0ABT8KQD5_9BACT|nr:hypothetical protein [Fulvivirgaceae bacterium BMA10]